MNRKTTGAGPVTPMSSEMQILLVVLGTVGVGLTTILITLGSKILTAVRESGTKFGSGVAQAMIELAKSSESLGQTVTDAGKLMVVFPKSLSETVASELGTGLRPLQSQLAQEFRQTREELCRTTACLQDSLTEVRHSQEQLQQTLMTINQDGHLGEWVETLRSVVGPLQESVAVIEQHHDTARQLFAAHSRHAEKFAGHFEHIEKSFIEFTNIVATENAGDAGLMAGIEQRVMTRLEEVAEIHAKVAENLAELQSASATLSASNVLLV